MLINAAKYLFCDNLCVHVGGGGGNEICVGSGREGGMGGLQSMTCT